MLKHTVATALLLSGLVYAAPAMAQSALAQQAATPAPAQSKAQQTAKSSTAQTGKTSVEGSTAQKAKSPTAKSTKPAASKPAAAKPAAAKSPVAKKEPPKPLVYVDDRRSVNKTQGTVDGKTAEASAGKPGDASVKKASASMTPKSSSASATPQPLSSDVTKAFAQNCPSVELTDKKSRAAFEVTFEREPGSKGVKSAFGLTNAVHKTSRIDVMNKGGKELFSETGHSTGQLVKDACTAMGTPVTKMAKK